MDLLKTNVKTAFLKYLAAAFGSALISSVYGIVDMAMVGQYQGSEGVAALSVVAPVWNLIYSLGLLTGIGGSVLLSGAKGNANKKEMDAWFTTSLIFTSVLALLSWLLILFFEKELLYFFGADEQLLTLATDYLSPIRFVLPAFLFNQMLAAFLRSDDNPALATLAVLSGGVFNIFGDYFFVFFLDMGVRGAGLATGLGSVITLLVLLSHFMTKRNTLALTRPKALPHRMWKISVIGFSTFVIDLAMGILTIFFNRQIMRYLNASALAVYGVIVNVSTIIQCMAYGIGEAGQPLAAMNHAAGKTQRVRETLKCMFTASFVFAAVCTSSIMLLPNAFIRLFMAPDEEILNIAPLILRLYGISFIFLEANVASTYFFQAVLKPATAMLIASFRGIIISGAMIYLLPLIFSGTGLWIAMPITETVVFVYVLASLKKTDKEIMRGNQH
jgi:putative efflux protein, MATE family